MKLLSPASKGCPREPTEEVTISLMIVMLIDANGNGGDSDKWL